MAIRASRKEITSFMFIMILTVVSNDTFLFGSTSNEMMSAIPRYGLLLFSVFFSLKLITENRIALRALIPVGLLVILMLISCLHNGVSTSLLVIKVTIIISGFLFVQYYDFDKWSIYFRKVMYFLSICSIVMTVITYIVPSLIRILPTATNTAGVKMYLGFFSGILDVTIGNIFIRCPGIFWEPGVYQMYLNVALLLTLYSSQEKKSKYIVVYLLAVLFTYSTTGFIATAWIFITYFLFSKNENRSISKNILYFILLLATFIGIFLMRETQLFSFIFGKLNRTDGSYIARLAGFVINYELALDHPLFGVGADMVKMSEEFMARSSASTIVMGWTQHNTNTLMYQFAAFGIPFGILYMIGTFNFGRNIVRNPMSILSIFGTFVLMYAGENLFSSIFPYILLFYGMSAIGKRLKDVDITN